MLWEDGVEMFHHGILLVITPLLVPEKRTDMNRHRDHRPSCPRHRQI
jgi:hypothetical protein